jgi:hypothetical protein
VKSNPTQPWARLRGSVTARSPTTRPG